MPVITALRPIETVYRGYRFRSRLEARWAVFFQTLGVPWEYEPQGYKLSDGRWSLADFRVKLADHVLWAEVKPGGIADDGRFYRFLEDLGDQGETWLTTRGTWLHEIPDPDDVAAERPHGPDGYDFRIFGDIFYQFCVCSTCNAVGFEFEGRSARIECGCRLPTSGRDHTHDHPRILNAYAAARAARFGHGESVD